MTIYVIGAGAGAGERPPGQHADRGDCPLVEDAHALEGRWSALGLHAAGLFLQGRDGDAGGGKASMMISSDRGPAGDAPTPLRQRPNLVIPDLIRDPFLRAKTGSPFQNKRESRPSVRMYDDLEWIPDQVRDDDIFDIATLGSFDVLALGIQT